MPPFPDEALRAPTFSRESKPSPAGMKILFFARALGPGGAERQLALMAAGLQRRGCDVTVATFYPGGNFASDLLRSGARHVCLEKNGRWDIIGFGLRFRNLVKRERPDILYSLLPSANIIAACLAPQINTMSRVWGVRVSDMQLLHYGWLERLSYVLERHLARMADMIIFNSQSGLCFAKQRGMFLSDSHVVPNGIDTMVFAPDESARKGIRDAWGIVADERVVGVVGRFDPMKDHQNFLAAAKRLLCSRPNLQFVLVGAGIEAGNRRLMKLLRAVDMSDRVILLGERSDMPAIMAGLDILCLSSAFGEGFPNVLGEAMAVGTPCVTTDVGDSQHVVGDTGEAVPPGDPVALAGAMERLLIRLDRSQEQIQSQARARIVEKFSVESLSARTESLLRQLVQRHGSAVLDSKKRLSKNR